MKIRRPEFLLIFILSSILFVLIMFSALFSSQQCKGVFVIKSKNVCQMLGRKGEYCKIPVKNYLQTNDGMYKVSFVKDKKEHTALINKNIIEMILYK